MEHLQGVLSLGRATEALQIARDAASELHALGETGTDLALVELVHARAAAAAGESDEARAVAVSAVAALHERADRIRDPGLRESFLQGVPEHRELVRLAEELGSGRA